MRPARSLLSFLLLFLACARADNIALVDAFGSAFVSGMINDSRLLNRSYARQGGLATALTVFVLCPMIAGGLVFVSHEVLVM